MKRKIVDSLAGWLNRYQRSILLQRVSTILVIDVLLKLSSGTDMRKAIKGYNLEFLNVVLALVCAVIVVAYFMYTMSPQVLEKMGTYRLYYTCLFVLAGIMRYLQIIFVQASSGSPTKILYKDRFIQATLLLWIASFYLIIYMKDITIFK